MLVIRHMKQANSHIPFVVLATLVSLIGATAVADPVPVEYDTVKTHPEM